MARRSVLNPSQTSTEGGPRTSMFHLNISGHFPRRVESVLVRIIRYSSCAIFSFSRGWRRSHLFSLWAAPFR